MTLIGADLIKVQMEAGAGRFWRFRYMAPEDVKAIVEDAHRLGMKVAAHAVDKANISQAIGLLKPEGSRRFTAHFAAQ